MNMMRVGLHTCGCAVCSARARCRGRREAPSGEACGSHQEKIHLLENGLKVLKMAF